VEEARRFSRRFQGELAPRERAFLDAVLALATRSTRRKRWLIAGTIAFLASDAAGFVTGQNIMANGGATFS